MSQRKIRRAQQRAVTKDRRRAELKRRRAGLAVSAAIGATALLAPAANAATFEVTSLADAAADACDTDCTLRDAITDANGNGEDDTITFQSGLTGTIGLTEGQLQHSESNALTITGPGSGVITVSGDGDGDGAGNSRIFALYGGPTSISGLTLTKGDAGSSDGGAIFAGESTHTTLEGMAISGNAADAGGGILAENALTVRSSTISGNTANSLGGGISSYGKYAQLRVVDSTISNNTAEVGGGVNVEQLYKYSPSGERFKHVVKSSITGTTIADNDASYAGGGIGVVVLGTGDEFTISHSTISGNDTANDELSTSGGGIFLASNMGQADPDTGELGSLAHQYEDYGAVSGDFRTINTTISGNSADLGGGVGVGGESGQVTGYSGSIAFDNSTIASNVARENGGGLFLSQYETDGGAITSPIVSLTSTLVADNGPQDADRSDSSTGGGLDLSYSLVENAGDAPIAQTPNGTNIFGVDPQLGALGANGGPTATHLPTNVSPAVDRGKAPARLLTDQRGLARTVEGDAPNAPAGDGTDIGAVEVGDPAANPPPFTPLTPPSLVGRDLLPIAVIRKNRLRRQHKTPFIKGVARDDDGVDEVRVALVNKVENRCRVLRPSGEFGKFKRCGRVRMFLPADGTDKWRFELDEPLPIGYYVAYSRAYDVNGQPQMDFTPKSRRPFRIREK